MATGPGTWTWTSGSNQDDDGLNGKKGKFESIEWTEAEKQENPLRRGMIQTTQMAMPSNMLMVPLYSGLPIPGGPCMTKRYYWYDDNNPRTVGTPEAGFKDYVRYRKDQGYNGCMVVAGFPNWTEEKSDWGGGDWEDEQGNRPFLR